jgi:signal transduction histidine kinase
MLFRGRWLATSVVLFTCTRVYHGTIFLKTREVSPLGVEITIKITIKIAASFLATIALISVATAYYLPLLVKFRASEEVMLQTVLMIVVAPLAALGLLLTVIILRPIKKLGKAAGQIAKGNFNCKVYSGKINKDKVKKADELSQLVLGFEAMRRKVIELDGRLGESIKTKTIDLGLVNDELVEKEKILQRANAKLVGQREDLQRINEELSAKNKELSEANEKMQKLDKMKSDFILIAAHELRTPIQPIIGSVQLAEKGLMKSDQAWKIISSEAKRLSTVATYILDVSKIESGFFTYNMKPISVKQLIEGVTSSSSKFATQDGVISIKIDLDKDVKILGDKERLVQAFSNIMNNAARFAKNGTIVIQTRNNSEDMVEIKVVDDGPGIPAEILPILFSKFVTKTRENDRGTGLGLFITKKIIEAHSGSIKAENNSDRGATFTVSFPICEQPAALAETREAILD